MWRCVDRNDSSLQQKSIVYVSEVNHHNTSMVLAIIKQIIKGDLQKIIEENHVSHTNTVQPDRFSLLTVLHCIFGVTGTWNYSESVHGKGPCDSAAGSFKRQMDQAVSRHILSWKVIGVETANLPGLLRTIGILLELINKYTSYDNLHNKILSLTIHKSV